MLRLILVLCAATLLAPAPAQARPRAGAKLSKAELEADRAIVAVMQVRDRGHIEDALGSIQQLLAADPRNVAAHRLYQELAAMGRRNGRLVEAEYRHWLEQDPDDSLRQLLHASAQLTTALTTPGYFDRAMARAVEGRLAAAEAIPENEAWAHFVAADLEKLRGRSDRESAHVEAAFNVSPQDPSFRYDLVRRRLTEDRAEDAAQLCLGLVKDVPWRILTCAVLFEIPRGSITDLLAERMELLASALEKVEVRRKNDLVTLRAIEEFYADIGERKGMRRVRARLAEVDPGWKPVVQRFPYLPSLTNGELSEDEVQGLEEIQTALEAAGTGAAERRTALRGLQAGLPESPRVRAYFHREMGNALRADGIDDLDGSRREMKMAMDLVPDDPHLRNAWAYTCALDKVDLAEALAVMDESVTDLLGEPFSLLDIGIGDTLADWEGARADSVAALVDTKGWLLHQLGRHAEAVSWLQLAALLSDDGTVQAHLGRARYALGNDEAAFMHLLRALALGTEEEEEVVLPLARHLYEKAHVVPGGLSALISEQRRELGVPTPDGDEAADLSLPSRSSVGADSGLVGEPAPRLAYEKLTGGLESLDDFQGRVVVLDFWASWCAPCRQALPMMESLARAFDGEGVVFVALSVDDSMEDARSFWQDTRTAMRVGLAEAGVAEAYRVGSIPVTFVISRDGTVVSVTEGFDPSHQERLVVEVIELLRDD
jgi:thiol-disulfide isomerase/thioredoxin/tetratricopeptide (TPR) repeat protein